MSAAAPAPVVAKKMQRFDRVERVVHWTNATLFFVLIATGASLKVGTFSTIIANRLLVKDIHVYSGLLLPIPVLLALILPLGREFRRDVSRFNRWSSDDRRWFSRRNRARVLLGKFNPGQKLNAVFIGAAIVVMFFTGSIMNRYAFVPHPDSWRTGATFVHDSTWLVLIIVIIGHIMFALRDPDSMRSMLRGWVPESWARRERPQWWADEVAERIGDDSDGAVGDVEARAE